MASSSSWRSRRSAESRCSSGSTDGHWSPRNERLRSAVRGASEDEMSDTAVTEHAEHAEHYTATGLDNRKLAMWAFLGSECLLFGALISAYLLYRGRGPGLKPHNVHDIPYTSVSSFVLLMSSLTMVLALSALQRKDQRRMRVWLLTTALLGATFIGGQVYEFTVFYRAGLSLHENLFGSSFFVLTGFHGAHVTIGILMLL